MSDTRNDSPVTCPSCEYRYPRSEGTCVMCGTLAPAIKPVQACSAMLDEFSPADVEALSRSRNQQKWPSLGLMTLVAVFVVSMGLALFASFRYELSKARPHNESGPAPEIASSPGQVKSENTGPQQVVHYSPKEAPLVIPASLVIANKTPAAEENDPAHLWDAVKRGSVHAEVALANLYLRGEAPFKNCEQAHILLLAASMKGSKIADNLLKSSSAERCQ